MSAEKGSFSAKLFYSYCHEDNTHRKHMERSLALLRDDKLLEDWSDQKILPGKKISSTIRRRMEEADILVFLLTQAFIASNACMEEWKWASKNISDGRYRIPVIVEDCAWLELLGSDDIMALPQDGHSVTSFENTATAWNQVYEGIKSVITVLRYDFTPKAEFLGEMEQTEFLSQEQINLSDLYTFCRLSCFTPNSSGIQLSEEIITDEEQLLSKRYALIHGSEMSGKTALSRRLFLHLVEQKLPVLHIDLDQITEKLSDTAIKEAYIKQFHGDYVLWEEQENKTLLLDNLTEVGFLVDFIVLAKDMFDRIIITLSSDVYVAFFRDEARLVEFYEMKIEPLTHVQQEGLIRRRLALVTPGQPITDGLVDRIENRLNSIIISNKIIPRYPFYVLTILQTYEAFMPDNLSFSSFGHCYHALIVAKLIKGGISQKDSDINACFNFAEQLSYRLYQAELNGETFDTEKFIEFVAHYKDSYIIAKSMLNRLTNAQFGILTESGYFKTKYMYYFFLGRYFAKAQTEHGDEIGGLCDRCHVGTNRLILLFVIHHTNDDSIIEEIMLRTMCSIEGVDPAILDNEESSRFLNVLATVPKNILTDKSVDSQRRVERNRIDERQGKLERIDEGDIGTEEIQTNEIYRVLKCNQILGQILRNKSGSLKREKIEEIIETIADGGLRLVNCILKDER